MRTLAEIEADLEAAETRVRELSDEREACQLANSKYKVGDVIKFGSKQTEGKIVAVESRYGKDAMPTVVLKKANGQWGARHKRLFSWDLERGT